jgi:hypothetical protein
VAPNIKVLSQLPRHMINVDIGGRFSGFRQFDDLDYTDGHAFVEGLLDIDAGTVIGGTAQTSLTHEDAFAAEAPRAGAEPVPLLTNRIELGFLRDAGRLTALLGGELRYEDFGDVRAYDGSTLDQDIRDNTLYAGFARLGYRFSPGYTGYVAGRVDRQLFTLEEVQSQNSTRYKGEVGLQLEANPLLRFIVSSGLAFQDIDGSTTADTAASIWRGEMQWLITQRMTLTLEASRGLELSTQEGTTGLLTTALAGTLQYDLFHNAEVKLQLSHYDQEFLGSSRLDSLWIAGAQFDYWLNRNAILTLGYEYRTRDSTDDLLDYEDNRLMGRVRLAF